MNEDDSTSEEEVRSGHQDAKDRSVEHPIVVNLIVTLIGGFAVVVVGLLVWYYWQRPNPSVRIVATRSQVISKRSGEAQGFRVMWKDREVDRADIFTFTVINDGNQVIEKVDFDPPVSVTFLAPAVVVKASLSASRESLSVGLDTSANRVTLHPVRLDIGDSVTIDVLAVDPPGENLWDAAKLSGHIYKIHGDAEALVKVEPDMANQTPGWQIVMVVVLGVWWVFWLAGSAPAIIREMRITIRSPKARQEFWDMFIRPWKAWKP